MRVGDVVVEDQMNVAPLRDRAIDLLQEGQELGVSLAGPAPREDSPVQNVQRGKQVRRVAPNVLVSTTIDRSGASSAQIRQPVIAIPRSMFSARSASATLRSYPGRTLDILPITAIGAFRSAR